MSNCHYSTSAYLPVSAKARSVNGLIEQLQRPHLQLAITSSCLVGTAVALANGSPFTAFSLLAVPGLLYPHLVSDLHIRFNRACRKCGWSSSSILGLVFGLTIATAFFISSAAPAHALFYKAAEEFMKTKVFTGVQGADTMIGLTVNVLRAIFVIYIGIAVVSVVQKMQQGDDWQTAARIPLVVLLCAAIGDRMSEMIVGSGGTTAAN